MTLQRLLKKIRTFAKGLLILLLLLFISINVFIIIQAYSFTHYKKNAPEINLDFEYSTILTGVDIPKPKTLVFPDRKYETIQIKVEENKNLEAWYMNVPAPKGLVILFHGFKQEKSEMLDRAYAFYDMGYNVLLVDFMGSGNSYGVKTTIGYEEAENVKTVYDYAVKKFKGKRIILYGFSMGAAAVTKAQHDYKLPVSGIILEAPYGRMLDAVKVRLGKAPYIGVPFAYVMTFWGGVINGYNAFSMNPEEFVKTIEVPVLLMYGGKDPKIPESESKRIFNNIKSTKKMIEKYPNSYHESYIKKYPEEWKQTIHKFLKS